MNIKKKLSNPFALVAQGFVAGAILFVMAAPSEADQQPQRETAQSAAASRNLDG